MHVYPAIREHLPNGDAAVEDDTQERKELETLGRLRSVFEHPLSDEEGEQFPQLRAHIPAERLVGLKGKVETAKGLAPTRPHPAAPDVELFHKAVGPGVGLVDRLRDRLTGRST